MDEEFNQCYVFKRKSSANNIIAISIDQSLQEMRESHGQRLSGVAKRLRLTGKAGNRKSNIERDMHRHVGLKVCMHLCIYAYLICYSVVWIFPWCINACCCMQVPITFCPVPFYKSATDSTIVIRLGDRKGIMHMHGPINYILFGGFPARQMPVVLPHDLVSAMAKAGIWPSQIGKAESVRDWWEHNAKKNNWYCNHPAFTDQKHEPLCLYGDDACLTKAGNEKMVCITLSHCLDTRSDSLVTSWPLCLFRCVSWID